MDLHISLDRRAGLAEQIYRQIRDGVRAGRLRPGEALPATRVLATRLHVSRNTVAAAYDRLAAEGLLTARTGSGTFVAHPPPAAAPQPAAAPPDPAPEPAGAGGDLRPKPRWADVPLPPDMSDAPPYDFRPGIPDARLFPYATWRRLLARQWRAAAVGRGMPCPPEGHAALRAAISRHLAVSRGVACGPQDVLVTSGTQQALDLVGRVLLEPGACVAMEAPGYSMAWLAWRAHGARVVGVPVDAEGLVVDALPPDARLVYVTASHQLPTGVAMSWRRRLALLDWADRHGAAVVEDDYDTEFRYTRQPLEPLRRLDRGGRVVYVGSFSKTLLPTLRLGYLLMPPGLRHALTAAKLVTDWHTSLPAQAALGEFIDQGGLVRHLRRVRREYRQRHERIAAALAGPLARWFDVVPSAAGLHLGAYLRDPDMDLARLGTRAGAAGVSIFSFAEVAQPATTAPGLVFGYGGIATERVEEGLRRLERCLQGL